MTTSTDGAQVFSALRFRGGRYERPGLPLESVSELARFERLVVDVARGLWKQEHQARARVPRGFAGQLRLRLTGIETGSVIPILERAGTAPISTDVGDYFEKARDVIEETFAAIAAGLDLPPTLPRDAMSGFVRFGSSLRGAERIEFRYEQPEPIVYTQKARRRLLARQAVVRFPIDGLLPGRITSLDAENHSFTITTLQGRPIPGSYSDDAITDDLHEVLQSASRAPVVRLDGRLVITAASEVQAIEDVDTVEQFEVPDAPWSRRLLDLAHLEAGWLDGAGEPPVFAALDMARELLLQMTERALIPLPAVFPMEDGGVQLEWLLLQQQQVVSLEVTPDLEMTVLNVAGSDLEQEYEVTIEDALDVLAEVMK